jgi:hypothetical protein
VSFARNDGRSQKRLELGLKSLIAVAAAALTLAGRAQTRADDASPPLLKKSDLAYRGAFRVPFNNTGDETRTLSYGGTAPAFNPARNSLFLVAHDHGQLVCEISIPKLVNSSKLSDLNIAQMLQDPAPVANRITNLAGINSPAKIGGVQPVDGMLVGTYYESYDANGSAIGSHFTVDDATNLKGSKVRGLFQVRAAVPAGAVAGYMCPIPLEWQPALGATYLSGLAGVNIVSRSSYGPAAVGLNLARLGVKPAPGIAYVYYPQAHPLADYHAKNPFFNLTTRVRGVVFVPHTRTILFFGTHALGTPCYGEASDCNDPNRSGKGDHVVGGEYLYYVWAYDALDFVAVRNGTTRCWKIKPYAVWSLDSLPFATGGKEIGGVTLDPASGTIYLTALHAERRGEYAYLPVIHAFQVGNLPAR